jgi:hypothetical protein
MKSNTAENGKLQYEAGQTVYAMEALTDSGDNTTFTSNATLWSDKSGYSPDVRPDGLISNPIVVIDDSAVNNVVDCPACTCYLAGVETSVIAAEITCARGAGADTDHIINSVIITAAGAYDVMTGTGHATAFSTTRGAAGGPPLITVGAIEVAQVKFTSHTDAAVLSSEIYQVPGQSQERYDYPLWEENFGPNQDGTRDGGTITFMSALPDDHVGPLPKGVYASYADPIFAELRPVSDFVPPENSHSVSSTQVYQQTVGSRSSSIGQGSFTSYLKTGYNDVVLRLKEAVLWFKFFPDKYKSGYVLCQGKLGVTRSYPADGSMVANCTISADEVAIDKES